MLLLTKKIIYFEPHWSVLLYFLASQHPLQKTLKGGGVKRCWEQGTGFVSLKGSHSGEAPCQNIFSLQLEVLKGREFHGRSSSFS